jgi:hypothetical protein
VISLDGGVLFWMARMARVVSDLLCQWVSRGHRANLSGHSLAVNQLTVVRKLPYEPIE